jgi:glycerate kinase
MTGDRRGGTAVAVVANCMRGTATARTVARAIGRGAKMVLGADHVAVHPAADGGDGTVDVMADVTQMARHETRVVDALGRVKNAAVLVGGGRAIVETASLCGLADLRPDELDPLRATSAGVGMAIDAAIEAGARHITVGAGGTAVVDAGAGALAELGAVFTDRAGVAVPAVPWALADAVSVDLRRVRDRLRGVAFEILADVRIPFTEAIDFFGPQKGVSDHNRAVVQRTICQTMGLLSRARESRAAAAQDSWQAPWLGAGGGIGAGLSFAASVHGTSGALGVLEAIGALPAVLESDLVITAEGQVDRSTWRGKLTGTIAGLRAARNLPTTIVTAKGDGYATAPPYDGLVRVHRLGPRPGGEMLVGEPLARGLLSAGVDICRGLRAS